MIYVFRKKPQTGEGSHYAIEHRSKRCRHWREFLSGAGSLSQMTGQLQPNGKTD
jgi:hypothetical protein